MKKKLSMILAFVFVLLFTSAILTGSVTYADDTLAANTGTSYEEPMPAIEPGFAYFKINFKLPEGECAGEKGLTFDLYSFTTNSVDKNKYENKRINLLKGVNSYTAYLPVTTTGGSASCKILFRANDKWNYYTGGYYIMSGNIFVNSDNLSIKEGSVQGVTLNAYNGIKVSGKAQLFPEMEVPTGSNQEIEFDNAVGEQIAISRTVSQDNSVSFNTVLPAGFSYDVYLKGTPKICLGTIKVEAAATEDGSFNIQVIPKTPEKVALADTGFEKAVRKSLNTNDRELYNFMLDSVRKITLDGNEVKDLSDLAKLPHLSELVMTNYNYKDINSYTQLIGSLKNLRVLHIDGGNIKDISFIKNLTYLQDVDLSNETLADLRPFDNLMDIKTLALVGDYITDFSPLSNMKKLIYLNIEDNKASNLDCLKTCTALQDIRLGANYPLMNVDFLKALPALRFVNLSLGLPFTDITGLYSLFSLNDKITVTTAYGGGKKGIDSTIQYNNTIKKILANIIKPGMTDFDKALAVHDYLCNSVYYSDTEAKYVHSAIGAIMNKSAVCEGYMEAYNLLMNSLGIECKNIVSSYYSHGWNLVKIDNQWYHVDCTWDCFHYGHVSHQYFLNSDEQAEGHIFSALGKPACTLTKYEFEASDLDHPLFTKDQCEYYLSSSGIVKKKFGSNNFTNVLSGKIHSPKIYKNYCFYQTAEKTALYRTTLDFTEKTMVYKATSGMPFHLFSDKNGIWIDDNSEVKLIDENGKVIKNIGLKNATIEDVTDKWIYFFQTDGYLYRVNKEGKEKALVTKRGISKFKFTDNYLVFVDARDNNNVISINPITLKEKMLFENNLSYEIFDKWVYYQAKDKGMYRIKLDGSENQRIFSDVSEMK